MRDFIAREGGLMTARMKGARALVIGKTNMPEFGLGSHTFNEVFGATFNAYDVTKSAGGSSDDAAVALALGLLPWPTARFVGQPAQPGGVEQRPSACAPAGRVPMWPRRTCGSASWPPKAPWAAACATSRGCCGRRLVAEYSSFNNFWR